MEREISIVLHRPIYARNVGMCARAMANMGLSRLILIAPVCDPASEEAKQGAAHAQTILREAVRFETHRDYLESCGSGIRIALSGRDGRLKRPDVLNRVLEQMVSDPEHLFHRADTTVHLLFGPEDDGLSYDEMELANHVCRLPTFGEITSLNLSHAVLLTCYLVREAQMRISTTATAAEPAKRGPAYYPSESIRRWLEALGFDLSARRVSIEKTINRILLSRSAGDDELRILDSVLQQTIRKLRGEEPRD